MVDAMASPRTAEREEERRFNLRTLTIASAASATAAVVTSQLWIAGTWIAAATTPVIVALVSELLHRPTEKIAQRLTTDRPALAEAAGPAPPARPEADPLPPQAPAEPGPTGDRPGVPVREPEPTGPGPVRVYRSSATPPRRRKIAVGAVLGTAALALVIAVAALTVPELIAGGSIGKGGDRTTFFSGDRDRRSSSDGEQREPTNDGNEDRPEEQPRPDEQTTEETTTEEETETVPTTPPAEEPTTPTTPTSPPAQEP